MKLCLCGAPISVVDQIGHGLPRGVLHSHIHTESDDNRTKLSE